MTDMSQATDNTSASTAKMNGINGSHYLTHDNPDRIQIIDDQKKFTPELTEQIRRWDLGDVGFDYDIVAVFGSQSTGKSTLLNRLFGTNFDVMDESKRQQTTKGIWMCRGADMNVMVMDVEGTDGRERGEDQDFERKSALFSLASSEVLIVNLWEHQVGLYQGANMGLLKTVFEVNLGLFGKSQNGTNQRTLLLFVIRDHIGTTPLENLCATLTADMNKIWESLSKPDELQDRKLSDYFDLSFTALPHKILAADKFEHDVQQLRRRFTDKEREDYVFKSSYHKRIPADGVALYMEGIWEQVQSNKDLDLPTQQELLAQFRCDEISAAALIEFNEQAKSQRRPVETGRVVDNLGQMMRAWSSRTLEQYDRNASRYHQGVYNRKRADLIAVIDSTLSPLYLGQLKNLHKFCLNAFKKQMLENMRTEGYNFAEVVADARARCEKTFTEAAKEARLEDTEWTWEDEFDLLMEDVKSVADQCRADETKKMVNSIERNLRRQISEPVELHLDRARSDMWDKVLSVFKETLQKAESAYMSKAKSFGCTQDENVSALATLRKRAWVALRAKITEQTADSILLSKLKSYFEERFRYDEKGIPRVWKPDDDIDGAFKKARDETVQLIPLYSKIEPTDPSTTYELPADSISISLEDSQSTEDYDFPASLVIFSENKVAELSARFRKDVDAYYIEAKRSMVSSIAQIPPWMYGALLVLGWNEAMAVLFNPLYFTMLLIGLSLAFGIIKLGLAGPLMQITRTLTNEIQRQATNKLREQFSNPELTEPVHTKPLEEAFEQLEMEDRNNSTESKRDIEPL